VQHDLQGVFFVRTRLAEEVASCVAMMEAIDPTSHKTGRIAWFQLRYNNGIPETADILIF
jgi:hypothetical protein